MLHNRWQFVSPDLAWDQRYRKAHDGAEIQVGQTDYISNFAKRFPEVAQPWKQPKTAENWRNSESWKLMSLFPETTWSWFTWFVTKNVMKSSSFRVSRIPECIWEMEYAVGNMRWECAAAFPAGVSTLRDLRPLLALAIPPPSSDTLIIYTTSSRDNELYTIIQY